MANADVRLTDEEEQAKAKAIVDYYRICFAQPAVKGILMWGFWEGANWIPMSSLYRRDWSPTPAAEAYRDLVFKQWWTTWQGKADAAGRCEVRAFYGRHRVTAGGKETVVDAEAVRANETSVSRTIARHRDHHFSDVAASWLGGLRLMPPFQLSSVSLSSEMSGLAPAQEMIPQAPLSLHRLAVRVGLVSSPRTAIPLQRFSRQRLPSIWPLATLRNRMPE